MADVIKNTHIGRKGKTSCQIVLAKLFARFNMLRDSYMRDQNHLQRMYEYSPAMQHIPFRVWKRHGAMLHEIKRQRH